MHKPELQLAILTAALNSVLGALFRDPDMPAAQWRALRQSAAATLAGLNPGDALQAALASRVVSLHFTADECFRRACLPGTNAMEFHRFIASGTGMTRLMHRTLALLDSRRGRETGQPEFPISDMALVFANLASEWTEEEAVTRAPGAYHPMHQPEPAGSDRPSARPGADRKQDPMHVWTAPWMQGPK